MSDFVNGIQNASEYLNRTTVTIPDTIDVNDQGVVSATGTSYSMKEIICSLLGGNGINLPNLQICLKVNIARLLGEPSLPNDIRNALNEAESALDEFIAHTNIDNALNRLNSAVAEFAAIANMINFCGTPVTPRAIPNVLKDAMGSFTGAGKDILDTLGTIAESDIGGCIGTNGQFSPDLFTGGLLKQLGDNFNNLANIPASIKSQILSDLNAFKNDMSNLIEFENNFASTDTKGGSSFTPGIQPIHTGVGAAFDAENMTFSQAQALASQLQTLYNQLSNYEVDDQGNNIFHYLLTPDMIANLGRQTNPTVPLSEPITEYDPCGKPISVTYNPTQGDTGNSLGAPVENVVAPGSTGLQESGAVVFPSPSTTTNLADTAVAGSDVVSKAELKQIVADSVDFADFKNRIQNL